MNDYLCEMKLKKENPALHTLFENSVFCIQNALNKYQNMFPTYTDHTILHSIEVIAFCNELIGKANIDKLNVDEIYILLMSAYLHDSGMGITMKDYDIFKHNIDFGNYFDMNNSDIPKIIRDFHNEFSGEYIKKYAQLFEIPSQEHIFAIVQVSRGHRKVDLWDEKQYPSEYKLNNGNTVCLPYLAALIRLADELDIAADRNLQFVYDINKIDNEKSLMEFKKHKAIKHIQINKNEFEMSVDKSDKMVYEEVKKLKKKLEETMNYCINVVEKRTPFVISQKKIIIS